MTITNSTNSYASEMELQLLMRKYKRLEIESGGQKKKMVGYQGNTKTLSKLIAIDGMGTTFGKIKAKASPEIQAALSYMDGYINSCVWEHVNMSPPDGVKWNKGMMSVC